MKIDEWMAQLTGTVETLTLAYGAMVVTHPDPEAAMNLLESMAKEASISANDSPRQKAYKTGTATAIASLSQAVEFARKVKISESGGAKH